MQCNSESKFYLDKTRKIFQNDLSKQKKIDHEQKPTISFTFTYIWKECVNNSISF